MLAGALDGVLVAGIRVPHNPGCRVVPEYPPDAVSYTHLTLPTMQ